MPAPLEDADKYPRRVLLAVTGLSPQIVTETLYALAVESRPTWIPTEIRIITTRRGEENARLTLLSDHPGWFHRLCEDYRLPAPARRGRGASALASEWPRPIRRKPAGVLF